MTYRHGLAGLFFMCWLTLSACSNDTVTLDRLDKHAIILAFGDSLTYGTGVNPEQESYPARLAQLTNHIVVNQGVPGELSAEGLQRLPGVLHNIKPDLVILCHGGNDLIRQLDKTALKQNLRQMIALVQASGAQIVLLGVPSFNILLKVPDLYEELANEYHIPVDKTTLRMIEADPELKSDQVHFNAQGYQLLAQHIKQLLQDSGAL